jgi:hypothetical protein
MVQRARLEDSHSNPLGPADRQPGTPGPYALRTPVMGESGLNRCIVQPHRRHHDYAARPARVPARQQKRSARGTSGYLISAPRTQKVRFEMV